MSASGESIRVVSFFQAAIHEWMMECFGVSVTEDVVERTDRFVEEALELAQATGWTADRGHALVDYVFGRPVGEVGQEVGGVMVTLSALCSTHSVDVLTETWREIDRITTPAVMENIRAKQASKPTGSALPIAVHRREPLTRPDGMPDWIWEVAYDQADKLSDLFGCDEVKRDRVTVTIGEAIVDAFAHVRTSGNAFVDVMAERDRQVLVEGWSQEHDDQHDEGELASAAACYLRPDLRMEGGRDPWPWWDQVDVSGGRGDCPVWGKEKVWFKPKDRRRDLVRAAALIVAEIERLDRATARAQTPDARRAELVAEIERLETGHGFTQELATRKHELWLLDREIAGAAQGDVS